MIDHSSAKVLVLIWLILWSAALFLSGIAKVPPVLAGQPDASRERSSGPQPGVQGLDATGCMQINDADRCPVCAMKVANYPNFSSALQLTDGRTYYFCGSGCMIRAWLHPDTFLAAPREDIKRAVVRDYFSGEQFDALAATWVAGSDVIGPMGPAMVPLKDAKLVEVFKRRHGGRATFLLQQMTDEKWQQLTGKRATP
ncbi:nitrous oxide reductase accessory protein NosL [Desulfoferrobacter suflitae]|uniref:nitrous oxide reductase accessory protein NosL n=1 Tax=Desulfoferrobacter suflitae TaxID=2865782 RepID=UPI0021647D53|nr:nitrous oxide reductase accessory protein NosL [Desulfoferrobacter suflitae]MCK8603596.1 nitrous oxide reductase accessory protein NosL [Desulfoferrobacter suflitae]